MKVCKGSCRGRYLKCCDTKQCNYTESFQTFKCQDEEVLNVVNNTMMFSETNNIKDVKVKYKIIS